MKSNKTLENTLKRMEKARLIVPRIENNPYLKISYKGTGGLVSTKWNIKIYNTDTIVCVDTKIIRDFFDGCLKPPDSSLITVKIDDSGWGFPLCGVLVGVEIEDRVEVGEVSVEFFKPKTFRKKEYLWEYSRKGQELLKKVKADPSTHRIEICHGFINGTLREDLRRLGYDTRNVEITGLLQSKLEEKFKSYVIEKTGLNLAYDPKEISKREITNNYYKALEWGQNNAPHLLKSGWMAIQQKNT